MSVPRKDILPIGVIARAHGVRGEVRVHLYDPESRALDGGAQVLLLRPKSAEIETRPVERVRRVNDAYLLTLAGVTTRDGADLLRGTEVAVHRKDLPPLAEGEFLLADLVGLRAVDVAGNDLGEVVDILHTGAQDLAVLVKGDEERLIPLVPEMVVEVGPERVVFDPPEDLPVEKLRK